MAQQVTVTLVDDLDGSASGDVSTIMFGLDGGVYEIDLSDQHATELRSALDEFVRAARRTGGRVKRGGSPPPASQDETRAVREWANEHGYNLAERGRIPNHVIEAYKQAKANADKPEVRRAKRKTAEAAAR